MLATLIPGLSPSCPHNKGDRERDAINPAVMVYTRTVQIFLFLVQLVLTYIMMDKLMVKFATIHVGCNKASLIF